MVKIPPASAGDPLEEEMATYSLCLGNPMDREAWQAIVHGVTKESDSCW